MRKPASLLAVVLLALAACGGLTAHAATPPVSISLVGQSHAAGAGRPWRFTLRVTTAAGRPLRAGSSVRVVAYGQRLDTIGDFAFVGRLSRTYHWAPLLAGMTAEIEARVVVGRDVRTVSYRVHVVGETGRPRFKATLIGSGHRAIAGKAWHFLVRALDAHGNSIAGTAIVRVVARGRIVDTVGWFGFRRRILRAYRWSPSLVGSIALLQTKVVGPGGTRTIVYPVRVTA